MSWRLSCRVLLAGFCLVATDQPASDYWQIYTATALSFGSNLAVVDLMADVRIVDDVLVTRQATSKVPSLPPCRSDRIQVAVRESPKTCPKTCPTARGCPMPHPTDRLHNKVTIRETRCGGGRNVVIRGTSTLSTQWATYDFLQRLGIRYFHPEQTVYPKRLRWPAHPINIVERPDFQSRSIHVHREHPVELLASDDIPKEEMAGYQKRWVDWNVKCGTPWLGAGTRTWSGLMPTTGASPGTLALTWPTPSKATAP